MWRIAGPLLLAVGVLLLAAGYLAGIVWIVVGAVYVRPELALVSWPGERRPLRVPNIPLFWVLSVALLWVLVVGVALLVAFLLGMGSVVGLVTGASAAVLSTQGLYRLEPARRN